MYGHRIMREHVCTLLKEPFLVPEENSPKCNPEGHIANKVVMGIKEILVVRKIATLQVHLQQVVLELV